MHLIRWIALGCTLCLPALGAGAEGAYTDAQAARGKQAFGQYCVECHHGSLRGSAHGPALVGSAFAAHWGAKTTGELATFVRTQMATTVPASAGADVFADLAAYVLQANGAPAGDATLTTSATTPVGSVLGTGAAIPAASSAAAAPVAASGTTPPGQPGARKWEGAIGIAEAAEKAGRWVNRETPPLTTVTDDMLRNPPAADWLNWRRTLDGHGYSPLAGIDRSNVGHLKLAWTLTMHEGSNQGTPLIHDGVMFLTHPGNVIQALDAASGDLLWEYAYTYPTE
jgi:alcohol dehydrogenase (cytochrome c)